MTNNLTMPAERLEIAGFEPFSACDWPGKFAAVLFLQGCPWRCAYCHNFSIIDAKKPGVLPWEHVVHTLKQRQGLLDGVVFSGGEPTRQIAVVDAAHRVKDMGFAVGFHTGGQYPKRIEALLPLLDWVGLDIKAPSEKYQAVTGRATSHDNPMRTLRMLLEAGVDVQVRTTMDPLTLTEEDIVTIRDEVTALGVTDYVVQRVRADGTNPEYAEALTQYRRNTAHGTQTIMPFG